MGYPRPPSGCGPIALVAALLLAPGALGAWTVAEEQTGPDDAAEGDAAPQKTAADGAEEPAGEQLSDERKEEARRHFVSGGQRFEEGFFLEAIEHFNAAYDITASPEILYNIGRCYEELDQPDRAVEHYEMYLRLRPDAEDVEEVEERAAKLRATADEAEKDDVVEVDAEAEPEVPDGLRIGAALGFGIPLSGEWVYDPRRNLVPLDVMVQIPLIDWLYLTAEVTFAGFVGEEPKTERGYPTSAVGLYVGLMAVKHLVGRLGFFGRLGFEPHFIFRDRHEMAVWLAGQGGVGLHIALKGGWGLTVEALANFGPVFVPKADNFEPWSDPPSPAADIGARFGVVYAFE